MTQIFVCLALFFASPPVFAAEFDGSALALYWAIPFAGLLLSIALFPLFAPRFWHHHFGKVALSWALLFLLPLVALYGVDTGVHLIAHALLLEYVPFILLLLSLYVVSGGIVLNNRLSGSPTGCAALLAFGTLIASLTGTTGAAMLLIRPLLQAIAHRRYKVHTIVFFIFLVANVGGSLSPLGDPPLFLGFLNGVPFFWPLKALILPTLMVSAILLVVYWLIDSYLFTKEGRQSAPEPVTHRISVSGQRNIGFLAAIIGAVLLSGVWSPGVEWNILGVPLTLQDLTRNGLLLAITLLSLLWTPKNNYIKNHFSWFPIVEVAKLFAAIFIAIIPVIAILRAGLNGAMSPLIAMVTSEAGNPINPAYFWLTGLLSSFLDNAPTYLVFFNMAGGNAQTLMGPLASTLTAISMGAVYMGANTYIGNAPNFMIRSIAIEKGVKMPSFFGYMLWSAFILLPVFALVSFVAL